MNILIIRFSALGDLVTLEPTFRAIRTFYPKSNIVFVTSGIGKGLYSDSGYIDQFIVHKDFKTTKNEIKKLKYDLVFNLHCNNLSHRLLFFTKYKKLVNISANWFQKLLHIKVKGKPLENLILESGIARSIVDNYFFNKNSKIIKLPFVNQFEDVKDFKVAISTGSSEKWVSKKWGALRYKNLIKKLVDKNIKVYLVGTNLELEDEKIIKSEVDDRMVSFVNKTNLTELKNILGSVDLYVGNDSGPTHVAAATGTNTLTIFGSTGVVHAPRKEIYSAEHYVIKPSAKIECHPCYKQVCPTNMECMDDIKVESVFEKIMEIVNE